MSSNNTTVSKLPKTEWDVSQQETLIVSLQMGLAETNSGNTRTLELCLHEMKLLLLPYSEWV